MGVEYLTTQSGRLLDVNVSRVMAMKEVGSYFDLLVNDQSIDRDAIEVIRFSNVSDFKISFADCEHIVQAYRKPKNYKSIKGTIFVCETDLAYGIARMLQTAFEMALPEHSVFVVRSENELEALIDNLSPRGTYSSLWKNEKEGK